MSPNKQVTNKLPHQNKFPPLSTPLTQKQQKPHLLSVPNTSIITTDFTFLNQLKMSVDAFFEKVTVNADDKALRENRLKLLNEIREATRAVADFSKIEG